MPTAQPSTRSHPGFLLVPFHATLHALLMAAPALWEGTSALQHCPYVHVLQHTAASKSCNSVHWPCSSPADLLARLPWAQLDGGEALLQRPVGLGLVHEQVDSIGAQLGGEAVVVLRLHAGLAGHGTHLPAGARWQHKQLSGRPGVDEGSVNANAMHYQDLGN